MNRSHQDEALRASVAAHAQTGTELARGAIVNVIAILAANLRGIFTFLIARLLGHSALGTFGLAWSTTDLLSKVGTFGMDTSTIALVSARQARGDVAGSRWLLRRAVLFGLLFSTAAAVFGITAFQFIGEHIGQSPELVRSTSLLLLALPGIALYRISNGVSRGMKVMKHDLFSKGFAETLVTIAMFLVALAVGLRDLAPVIAVLFGTGAGGLTAFTLARKLFVERNAGSPGSDQPHLLRFSAPIALYSLLNMLIMRMDVLLLGLIGPAAGVSLATVGIFVASVEIAGGMRKVRQAFDPMFTPIIARQSAAGDQPAMEQSFAQLGRWVLAAQLPMMTLLCLSGGVVLDIFGPGFDRGALWVALLAIAHATNSFVGLAETVIMVRRPKWNLVNSAIAATLQLGVSLMLIPRLGATGAALGMVVAYLTQGVLRYCELRFLFAWHWPWRAFARPIVACLAATLLALPLRILILGWRGEVLAGLTFLALYLTAWRLIGLEESDRTVLQQLWKKKRARSEDEDDVP